MMSAFLKKLLFVRQFDLAEGKIEMLGKREIMLPSNFIFAIQDGNKNTYELIKMLTFENIKEWGDKIGSSEEGLIKNIKDIYETFGLGPLEITDLRNEKKEAIIVIRESVIAKEYSKIKRSSKGAKCEIIASILAGMFSYIFGSDVDAVETKCLFSGSEYCMFNVGKGVR